MCFDAEIPLIEASVTAVLAQLYKVVCKSCHLDTAYDGETLE